MFVNIVLFSLAAFLVNSVNTANSDPSEAPAICAAPNSDSILVAHEDCDKFYKCFEGKPYVINCPYGLLYNSEKEYCDWPQNVKCPSNQNAVVNDRSVEDASKICAEDGSNGVLVPHDDCSKFYECAGGRPVLLKCPPSLHFNPETNQCDWSENVKCSTL